MSSLAYRILTGLLLLLGVCVPAWSTTFPSATVTITGSQNGAAASGTMTIAFNTFSETVHYGPLSTASSIASAFAAKFSADPITAWPSLCTVGVCAEAYGAAIVFQIGRRSRSFGPISVTSQPDGDEVDPFGAQTPSSPPPPSPVQSPLTETSVVISSSNGSANFGTPLLFTATVAASDGSIPTGNVTIMDGGAIIGASMLHHGSGTVFTSNLAPGNHQLSATYWGDALRQSSVGMMSALQKIANTPPITSVVLNPAASLQGDTVTARVAVTSAPGYLPIGTVTCSSPTTSGVTQTLDQFGQAVLSLPTLPVGKTHITCTYTSSANGVSSSGNADEQTSNAGISMTGMMVSSRAGHIASLLPDGDVLIAGGVAAGQYSNNSLNTAEIYSAGNGTFSSTGRMNVARIDAAAVSLSDGTVLITGGDDISSYTSTAEYYDPVSSTFKQVGSMGVSRVLHTATLLPNNEVLIAGGETDGAILNSAEIYNPAMTSFMPTGSMASQRYGHAAVLLNTGKVLIAGGSDGNNHVGLNTTELYDPVAGTFSNGPNMPFGAERLTATTLPDGTILIAGGDATLNTTPTASAAIYDPGANTFTSVGSMHTARTRHTATLLGSGLVLIAGGATGGQTSQITSTLETYDPSVKTFTNAGNMSVARVFATATLLNSNAVLLVGGYTAGSSQSITASADTFGFDVPQGFIDLKYLVVGVVYAPPGSGSSVNYTQGSGLTNTNSIDDDVKSTSSITIKQTYESGLTIGNLPIFSAGATTTEATNYGYDTDSSTTYQVIDTETNGETIYGPLSSAIGVDHDYDEIYIWFDPQYGFTFPNLNTPTVNWAGLFYKGCDTTLGITSNCDKNNYHNADVFHVSVLCLKNPYISNCVSQFAVPFARAWDKTGNGALTLQDMQTILNEDPYIANPNYDPTAVQDGRFTETSGTIQFTVPPPGGQASSTNGGTNYQSTKTVMQAISRSYGVSFSLDEKITAGFLGSFANELNISAGTTWTHKTTSSAATQSSNAATWLIKTPAGTDNYVGPGIFNPYHDNLYGSFMFFAPDRSMIPLATITSSSTSLSFGGVTKYGTSAQAQSITIMNASTVSMVMSSVSIATPTSSITPAETFSTGSFSAVNDGCTGITLPPKGSCTFGVQFSPLSTDLQPTGQTPINGTMIVQGVELAPGSTNLLITTQVALSGTGSY